MKENEILKLISEMAQEENTTAEELLNTFKADKKAKKEQFKLLLFVSLNCTLFYSAINNTPNVPGPQWLEITPPALVIKISSK